MREKNRSYICRSKDHGGRETIEMHRRCQRMKLKQITSTSLF